MSFGDTDTRPTYAVGFILDDSLKLADLSKLLVKTSAINAIIEGKLSNTDADGQTVFDEFILKNATPETLVDIYIAIGSRVPKQMNSAPACERSRFGPQIPLAHQLV